MIYTSKFRYEKIIFLLLFVLCCSLVTENISANENTITNERTHLLCEDEFLQEFIQPHNKLSNIKIWIVRAAGVMTYVGYFSHKLNTFVYNKWISPMSVREKIERTIGTFIRNNQSPSNVHFDEEGNQVPACVWNGYSWDCPMSIPIYEYFQ